MPKPLVYPWDKDSKVSLPARVPQLDQRATKLAGAPRYMPGPNTTDEKPPKAKTGHVVKRIDGAWVQVKHHRGETVYDKESGTKRKIGDGETGVPDGMTLKKPGAVDKWDKASGAWKKDPARQAEIDKEAARGVAVAAARERVIANSPDIAIVLGLIDPVEG